MECPKCKRLSRCGCNSCKSRVKYHPLRADKTQNASFDKNVGIVTCPYCRSKFLDQELLDYEAEYQIGIFRKQGYKDVDEAYLEDQGKNPHHFHYYDSGMVTYKKQYIHLYKLNNE